MNKYVFPPIDILKENVKSTNNLEIEKENAKIIVETLMDFKIAASVENVKKNSRITRYEIRVGKGIRIKRILNLSDDIALSLGVESIRIVSNPENKTIGIEIPNEKIEVVGLKEMIQSQDFNNNLNDLSIVIGENSNGKSVIANISDMPHLLVAGTTGSGKSVFINTLITSLLYKFNSNELKLILIDPKRVELSAYSDIPHLLCPIITDSKKSKIALNWLVKEMNGRYDLFSSFKVRDVKKYNQIAIKENLKTMPEIVVVIDEFADLVMDSQEDFENTICKLAQKARAAGIHLVIATQRPSVDVITGIIKANIPSRISFTVASYIDSRTILDIKGAENLLGKGDMLYSPINELQPIRVQGCYISDKEIESITSFIIDNNEKVTYNDMLMGLLNNSSTKKNRSVVGDLIEYYIGDRLATSEEVKNASYKYTDGEYSLIYKDQIIARK